MTPIEVRVDKIKTIMEEQYDEPTLVRDLLADVMHYCAEEKIDFHREHASGQMHFLAERDEVKRGEITRSRLGGHRS